MVGRRDAPSDAVRNTIRIGRTLARASGRPENPSGHPCEATGPPGGRQGIFSGFTREPQHLISDSATDERISSAPDHDSRESGPDTLDAQGELWKGVSYMSTVKTGYRL